MLAWYRTYCNGDRPLIFDDDICEYDYHVCSDSGERLFTAFKGVDSMYDYMFSRKQSDRCFFEIIPDVADQKLYFDVDIDGNNSELGIEVIKDLTASISKVAGMYDVNPEIMVFSSNGNTKQSYHVVVTNAYVKTADHNKSFAYQVRHCLSKSHREYVDILYKSSQQFRIYGSTKYGANRPKVYVPELSITSAEYGVRKKIFELSIVTYTEHCKLLDIPIHKKADFEDTEPVDDANILDVTRRMQRKGITGYE